MTLFGSFVADETARSAIEAAVVLGAGLTSYVIVRLSTRPLVRFLVHRASRTFDEDLIRASFLRRFGALAALIVVYVGLGFVDVGGDYVRWLDVGRRVVLAATLLTGALAASELLSAVNIIYTKSEIAAANPIKGYLQLVKIAIFISAGVLMIAVLADQPIAYIATGLGAMTAVLLLVFKETILSFVASVEITQNDLVRIGDWITVPSYGADGTVIDIALHTVKVQNFDQTITTVPTAKLVAESFQNWRGMTDAGRRRIKRAINIDMSTVRFLTEAEIEKHTKFDPLHVYMGEKVDDVKTHNVSTEVAPDLVGDPRRLTNVGTFRAYVESYLRRNPALDVENMTCLVRQLDSGPDGLPIEIYVFANDTDWVAYERVQADIFDHLLAMVPRFDLRVFQRPTGHDFRSVARSNTVADEESGDRGSTTD